jgi:hypothetical protein
MQLLAVGCCSLSTTPLPHMSLLYFSLSGDCDSPGNPDQGYFEGEDFTSGAVIAFYCEERWVHTAFRIGGLRGGVTQVVECLPNKLEVGKGKNNLDQL